MSMSRRALCLGLGLCLVAAGTIRTVGAADEIRMKTRLSGGEISGLIPSGAAEYRAKGSERRLRVEVEDVNLVPGTDLTVFVGTEAVGHMRVGAPPARLSELELDSRNGDAFPAIVKGTIVTVATTATATVPVTPIVSGVF